MSCIEPSDIGSRYSYSSLVMCNRLESLAKGKNPEIPENVLAEAREIFDFALQAVPHPSSKNNAYYLMVCHITKSLGYEDAGKKMTEFSESMNLLGSQNLPYSRLVELCGFFNRLHQQSERAASARILHGQKSPYTYV